MKFPSFIRIQEGDFRDAGSWFRRLALLLNNVLENHDRALRNLTIGDNFAGELAAVKAPFPATIPWKGKTPPRGAFLYFVEGTQPTQAPWPVWTFDGSNIVVSSVSNLPAGSTAYIKFFGQ